MTFSDALSPKESIRFMEELSLRSWPALESHEYDGWIIRFSDGYTRRANSINPLRGSTLGIDEKIARCESLYRMRRQHVIFKMTEAVYPEDLDEILAARGYMREAPTGVQILEFAADSFSPHELAHIDKELSDQWLSALLDLGRLDQGIRPTIRKMFAAATSDAYFASMVGEGQILALGLSVVDGDWAGLYDIVTRESYRRKGLAIGLIASLLYHAGAHGAKRAYLQVMANNVAAKRLYHKFGFREIYRYWYRVRDWRAI